MLKSFCIVLFSLLTLSISAQDIKVYKTFEEFQHVLHQEDNTLHVVNFWATWCKPCVAELPYFEELNQKYKDKNFKLTLVSLDFERDLSKRVIPFLEKNKYSAEVIILDDPKSHKWIDLVDKSWSGAIPITVFYKNDQRVFLEKEFHSLAEIEEVIKNNF